MAQPLDPPRSDPTAHKGIARAMRGQRDERAPTDLTPIYEHKEIPFRVTDLKARDNGWEVAGYASTFGGEPDSYGDIVAKGAFATSLLKRPDVRLLWQHDMTEPIGKALSLTEDDKGLLGHWSLVPTDTGTKAHQLLTAGLVDSLSIGFLTKAADYSDDGTRVLREVELVEVSLVTIPANTSAMVTSFKADQPLHLLLQQATEAVSVAVRQVKATHESRTAEGRSLNDRHTAALAAFLDAAEAIEELRALLVVTPEAKADGSEALALRLEFARRKYAAILRESA